MNSWSDILAVILFDWFYKNKIKCSTVRECIWRVCMHVCVF